MRYSYEYKRKCVEMYREGDKNGSGSILSFNSVIKGKRNGLLIMGTFFVKWSNGGQNGFFEIFDCCER